VRELAALLADLPFEVRALAGIPGASLPEEVGLTYAENALGKARTAVALTGALALGDDSGLEVDALNGAPGVRSARYGGAALDDPGRCALLLAALAEVPVATRTARFRCVVAVVSPAGAEHLVEGVAEGRLVTPRGAGGFGYDPIFYYPPLGRTFAELTEDEKARVSHRARALAAARRLLTKCYTRGFGG
jgi:XTP/dITP diphosphohydrolase